MLRERLDELGRRLGGEYRVLVDANQHVDREAAARSGVGFYGKNTMLITRRHGSWVVLGTLVTDRRAGSDAAARRGVRLLHALHRRVPDRRARGAGRARRDALPLVLDAVGRPDPRGVPRGARRPRLRLRHLPGRLPVEPRRREAACGASGRRRRATRLARRLAAGGRRRARASATTASSCRATTRATCAGTRSSRSATQASEHRSAGRAYAESEDPLLREHAEWALRRLS